jgi:protein PhnA
VVIIQDLTAKGIPKPIKKGTKIKNIRLVDSKINNGHNTEVEGFGIMGLKSEVVKNGILKVCRTFLRVNFEGIFVFYQHSR